MLACLRYFQSKTFRKKTDCGGKSGMMTHSAFGLPMEMLDIIVVEDSKPMQTIVRSILAAMNIGRVRMFDSAEDALQSMLSEPPNLIITDYRMSPMNGYQLLRSIRNRNMAPLCYVPVIMITAHGTRSVVEKAYRGGAHTVLVKPISPKVLHQRLEWVIRDARPFEYDETGHCVVDGVSSLLDDHKERYIALTQAREYHELMTQQVTQKQDAVDKIIDESAEELEELDIQDELAGPERLGGFARVREESAPKRVRPRQAS